MTKQRSELATIAYDRFVEDSKRKRTRPQVILLTRWADAALVMRALEADPDAINIRTIGNQEIWVDIE